MQKSKKLIALCILIFMFVGVNNIFSVAYADGEISVSVNREVGFIYNGSEFTAVDDASGDIIYPLTYNDRTYIPARYIAEKAGLKVSWDDETRTVSFESGEEPKEDNGKPFEVGEVTKEQAYLSSSVSMMYDGEEFCPREADGTRVYPITYHDRVYIPARFIAEKAGLIVRWDGLNKLVKFSTYQKGLKIYFIDVGQADSSLIISDGRTMLVDGGNVADSALIYTFLADKGIDDLDYVICTHAHEDHQGGLSAAFVEASVYNAYAPLTGAETKSYKSFIGFVEEEGLTLKHPTLGEKISLGEGEIQFFGPVSEETDNLNDTSIVFKLTYGDTKVLFTGDAEYDEEHQIEDKKFDLSSDVLKVSHHGSKTSTSYSYLREIMPKYAIVSVGADNTFGHPAEQTMSRLKDAGVTVFRTDLCGDIELLSDGKDYTVVPSKDNATAPREEKTEEYYIGNKNSKKFHAPDCLNLPKEENRVILNSREDAIEEGYIPCGKCKP